MSRLLRTLILATLVGVAGSTQSPAAQNAPVSISVSARIEGSKLLIRGRATVPDGAWIIYGAYRVLNPDIRATGYCKVHHERFAAALNISSWPAGKIKVDANFQVLLPERTQPQVVIARFGPHGERMIGKDVVKGGDSFRAAVTSTTVTKP